MTAQNSFPNPVEQQAMLDFVARMQDPQQALEDAHLEDEANCTIGAGADLGAHLGALMANPQEFYQHQRIRSLVMRELLRLLEECNLGAGLPDALKVGQQLLSKRLRQPAEEIQQQLLTAFEESMSADGPREVIPDSARSAIQGAICTVLSEQDWDAVSLAAATAIQQSLRRRRSLPKTA